MYGIKMRMEGVEKVAKMRALVKEELKHIPRGSLAQNFLRNVYAALRMHSLGKKAEKEMTPREVLLESIELTKRSFPDFEPKYDQQFFKV